MKCPKCHNDFDFESGFCVYCSYQLPDVYEEEYQGPMSVATTTNSVVNAELLAGSLRHEGIPAKVLSQFDTMRALTVGGLAIVSILVPDELVEQARELIDRWEKE